MKSQKIPRPIQYPRGSVLRAGQICTDSKTGQPGLVPWAVRTWYRKVQTGEIPQGILLAPKTRAWPIEIVEAIARGESVGEVKGPK